MRRIIDSSVTEADRFVDMPATSQALYLHLYMHADNDGFVESANGVRRMCGATPDDLTVLAAKGFVILWPDGVCLMAHWRVGNKLAEGRKGTSRYAPRLSEVTETTAKVYEGGPAHGPDSYEVATPSLPDSYAVAPNRREENRKEEKGLSPHNGTSSVISEIVERPRPDPRREEVRAVVSYLNAQTGKHFRADSRQTASAIRARLSEGFAVEDFRRVIDAKVADWGNDPRMEQYLRPSTLFRPSNFEAYANQGAAAPTGWHGRTFDYEEVTVCDDGS